MIKRQGASSRVRVPMGIVPNRCGYGYKILGIDVGTKFYPIGNLSWVGIYFFYTLSDMLPSLSTRAHTFAANTVASSITNHLPAHG